MRVRLIFRLPTILCQLLHAPIVICKLEKKPIATCKPLIVVAYHLHIYLPSAALKSNATFMLMLCSGNYLLAIALFSYSSCSYRE